MGVMIGFYLRYIHENIYPVSETMVGIIAASFFLTELLGAPIFGAQSDHYGRRLFMVLGALFGAIAVQLTAMTTVVWVLIITRFLEGLSTASSMPATLGYISAATATSPRLRGQVVSLFEIASIGGMALGFVAGGALWQVFRHVGFSLDSLIYLVSAAIFAFGVAEMRGTGGPSERSLIYYLRLLSSPRILRFAPAWLAVNAILGVWLNHVSNQMSRTTPLPGQLLSGGFNGFQIGLVFAAFTLFFVLGIGLWSLAFGRLRTSTIMLSGTGGVFGTCLTLAVANHLDSVSNPLFPVMLGLFFLFVMVMSGFTPAALAYLADMTEAHTQDRGAIMGLYSVFLGIGQLIGSLLGGPFAQAAAIDGVIAVTAILAAIAWGTVIALRRNGDLVPARGALPIE